MLLVILVIRTVSDEFLLIFFNFRKLFLFRRALEVNLYCKTLTLFATVSGYSNTGGIMIITAYFGIVTRAHIYYKRSCNMLSNSFRKFFW